MFIEKKFSSSLPSYSDLSTCPEYKHTLSTCQEFFGIFKIKELWENTSNGDEFLVNYVSCSYMGQPIDKSILLVDWA